MIPPLVTLALDLAEKNMINHAVVLLGIQRIVGKFLGNIDFQILPCCPHARFLNCPDSIITHLVIEITEKNDPVGFVFGQDLIGQSVGMTRIMTVNERQIWRE